jgi:metal-responsive CopG/Arc/MetJ family transcriptional regulator
MKNTIKFGTSIKKTLFDRLKKAVIKKHYKKSQIIEIALEKLFKEWKI